MACPYFEPDSAPARVWPEFSTRRAPLGDTYLGHCRLTHAEPSVDHQAGLCNHGYARGRCTHLPAEAPDAFRYSITAAYAGRVELIWIIERDHRPERHGSSTYLIGETRFDPPLPCDMAAQATVFVASYLSGKASQGRSELT